MINSIRIKNILDEDFQDYKKTSMLIATCECDWKCAKDGGFPATICQNCSLAKSNTVEIPIKSLYERYINNHISTSIVIGGLEPFLQFDEVYELIRYFRNNGCNDDFVIYTGYYKEEILDKVSKLKEFNNIIIKFGRFVPNKKSHLDNIIGVELANDEQHAERIC